MISQTAEYALRAVVCLARDPEARLTTPELAGLTGLPPSYLSKVLQALVRAGVIDSQRGSSGGFRLARLPGAVSLLEIVNAVDPMERHLKLHGEPVVHSELLALDRRLDAVLESLSHELDRTTLADLLRAAELPPPPQLGRGPLC